MGTRLNILSWQLQLQGGLDLAGVPSLHCRIYVLLLATNLNVTSFELKLMSRRCTHKLVGCGDTETNLKTSSFRNALRGWNVQYRDRDVNTVGAQTPDEWPPLKCHKSPCNHHVVDDRQVKHWAEFIQRGASKMTSFFDYEKENNALLNALRDEYKDLIKLISQSEASIFVPQSVSLENLDISRDLVETHLFYTNIDKPTQFVTQNGVLGTFNTKKTMLSVISPPQALVTSPTQFDPLAISPPTLFKSQRAQFEGYDCDRPKSPIHVLREGHITFEGEHKIHVPLVLISEPLQYNDCAWDSKMAAQDKKSKEFGIRKHHSASTVDLSKDRSPERSNSIVTGTIRPKNLLSDFLSGLNVPINTPFFPDSPEDRQTVTADPNPQPKKPTRTQLFPTKLKNAPDVLAAIRGFEREFLNNPPKTIEDQSKLFRSGLDDIENRILAHPLWKDAEEEEIEDAEESIEKYMSNKLFTVIFENHCKAKETANTSLTNRIHRLRFIQPHHLDIKPDIIDEESLRAAQKELNRLNNYKTPREKLYCIWNCCRAIYNSLKGTNDANPSGADEFLPILIYVVIRANPLHLFSNIQYVSLFRHPNKMITEMGYYFTHLVSAVTFIETVDSKRLSIDPDEFQRKFNGESSSIRGRSDSSESVVTYPPPRSDSVSDLVLFGEEDNVNMMPTQLPLQPTTVSTIVPASQSSVQLTYLDHDYEQLRVTDVANLLREYKMLAEENKRLRNMMGK
ncbi:hypothetical protein PROFUN_14126 [Planoprotostelium fungivorum]|uniref:VPS9 domain-containing protein n=1 Tax=Planoprotostelium fungivorum TaxID=1890364 RepID=A0A2P6N1D4_9EUKA|nr:hypothetical protein PROFUN_14126 [Planoprotostelium fungivorum]